MICPFCQNPMAEIEYAGSRIDQCTACAARWFDRTEFAAVMEHDVPSSTPQWGKSLTDHGGTTHTCPRDASPMKAMAWADIPFERCTHCSGLLVTAASWEAVHEAARARSAGKKFSVLEVVRDLFGG